MASSEVPSAATNEAHLGSDAKTQSALLVYAFKGQAWQNERGLFWSLKSQTVSDSGGLVC